MRHHIRLREPCQGLVYALKELVVVDGFLQVVECVDTESFDRIFAERCGEDDPCLAGQHATELHAIEVGHLDIEESHVNGVGYKVAQSRRRTVILALQGEEGSLLHIAFEQGSCQRFVIYDGTCNLVHFV